MKKILFVFVLGLFGIAIASWAVEKPDPPCEGIVSDNITEPVICDKSKQNCQVVEEPSNTNAVSVGGDNKKPIKPK